MKLASALTERSDLQRRHSELKVRLQNNAKVQEGDKPAEDPKALLEELDSILSKYEELVARINLTNSKTVIDGVTLTELLAKREAVKLKNDTLRMFLDNASQKVDRYSRTEIKIESTVDVKKIQSVCDANSKVLREIDEKIQEANWSTELM